MEQRLEIAAAVYHSHDAHPRFRDATKDGGEMVGEMRVRNHFSGARCCAWYLSAIIQKRIFLNGRRIGQHHPRRRRKHPSDYPCAWLLLTTSLQPMAALVGICRPRPTSPKGAIQTPRSGVERGIPVEPPVSYSLFPAFLALRSTYPANRPKMLSPSTFAGASGMDRRLL